jgi:hypothetical protein
MTINVLYRKSHYDLAYSSDFIKKHLGFLKLYSNPKERLVVVDDNLLRYYSDYMEKVDTDQSKIYNKRDKEKKLNENKKEKEIIVLNNKVDSNANVDHSQGRIAESIILKKEELAKQIEELKNKQKILENANMNEMKECLQCQYSFSLKNFQPFYKLPCGICFICDRSCLEKFSQVFITRLYKSSSDIKKSNYIIIKS